MLPVQTSLGTQPVLVIQLRNKALDDPWVERTLKKYWLILA